MQVDEEPSATLVTFSPPEGALPGETWSREISLGGGAQARRGTENEKALDAGADGGVSETRFLREGPESSSET